jgi:transposase
VTYRSTVGVSARFHRSETVDAMFGLTCAKYQSGEIDRSGRISRCGDEMIRVMLYGTAQSMLRSTRWCWLKAWAMQIAGRPATPSRPSIRSISPVALQEARMFARSI